MNSFAIAISELGGIVGRLSKEEWLLFAPRSTVDGNALPGVDSDLEPRLEVGAANLSARHSGKFDQPLGQHQRLHDSRSFVIERVDDDAVQSGPVKIDALRAKIINDAIHCPIVKV